MTQLHREFLRAGSDVLQSFTFFASDDALEQCGVKTTGAAINDAAVRIVKKVAAEGDALTGIDPLFGSPRSSTRSIRELPYRMSTKFMDFLTPHPLVHILICFLL